MPYCADLRWHKTQEETDACVKHLDDEDFDNLSTLSRTRSASHRLSSGPRRTRRTKTASPAATPPSIVATPSSMNQQDNEPANDPTPPPVTASPTPSPMINHDHEVGQATAINVTPDDRIPETPQQQTLGAGASKVPAWLENVSSEPKQVPVDNIEDRQQTPVRGLPCSIGPGPRQHPETPPTHRLNPTTPPRGQAPIRKGSRGAEQDQTPSRPAIEERAQLAGPERAWYQDLNFLLTKRAAVWGGVVGLLFMICVFWAANCVAARFP